MIKKILFILGAFVTCLSCHLPSDNVVSSDSIVQEDLDSLIKNKKRETRESSLTFSSQNDSSPINDSSSQEIAGYLVISNPPNTEEIVNASDKGLTGEPLKTSSCESLPVGKEPSIGKMIGKSKRIKKTKELSQGSLKIETTQQNIEIIYAERWIDDRPLKLEIVKYPHNYPDERQGKSYLRVTLNFKELATHNNLKIQLVDQSSEDKVVKECTLPQEYFSQNQEGIYRREFEFGQDADQWINFVRPAVAVYKENKGAGYLAVRFVDGSNFINWHVYQEGKGLLTFADIVDYYDDVTKH